MRLRGRHRAELIARCERRLAGPHQGLGWPERFRSVLRRLEDGQRRGFVGGRLDHIGHRPLPDDPLDQFDDLALVGEAPREFGVGILVVALGAHREQVGNLVLTPRRVVDAGTLAGFLGTGLKSTPVDEHDRQPGDDRCLGRRLLVLEILDPSIPIVLQFLAHLVGDPPHLPATDGDLGLIGEGFRGVFERAASRSGADDLTQDRWREVVRVELQIRAEREKNPGDKLGNDRRVRRTGSSRRAPEWFLTRYSRDNPAHTRDKAGDHRGV